MPTTTPSAVADKTPQAVEQCHQLLIWLIPQLDKFPRNRRYTLGERLESGLLTVLELLVAASYQQRKKTLLDQANRQLSVLRHVWRLAMELKVISHKRYEYGARQLAELGQQIGGWMKYEKSRRPVG